MSELIKVCDIACRKGGWGGGASSLLPITPHTTSTLKYTDTAVGNTRDEVTSCRPKFVLLHIWNAVLQFDISAFVDLFNLKKFHTHQWHLFSAPMRDVSLS